MNRLKDFFYDKSDIIVALVIVAVAAFVIVGRIDSILAYPSQLVSEASASVESDKQSEEPASSEDQAKNDSEDNSDADNSNTGTDSADKTENSTVDKTEKSSVDKCSVYIESGSTAQDIADLLVGAGLMDSKQQFYDAIAAAGAESKLKAGNFIIPSDATPSEVVSIITK